MKDNIYRHYGATNARRKKVRFAHICDDCGNIIPKGSYTWVREAYLPGTTTTYECNKCGKVK